MNSSGGRTPSTARTPTYNSNAMAMIRNELSQFANSVVDATAGQAQMSQTVSYFLAINNLNSYHTKLQPTTSQNLEREVLLIRQMLSQAGINSCDVSAPSHP